MLVVRVDPTAELAAEILKAGGCVRLVARGFSMLPAIFPGDTLEIRARKFENVRVGDVVFARNQDRMRIHRVVRETVRHGERAVITRGDALRSDDEQSVSSQDLVGCVGFILRRGRRLHPVLSSNPFHSAIRFVLQHSSAAASFLVRVNLLLNRRFATRPRTIAKLPRGVLE